MTSMEPGAREERLRIEGEPEELERLRRELMRSLPSQVEVEPISVAVPGELREPLLVGLLISCASTTAAVAIKTVGSIIERRMTHEERKELFRIYREKEDLEVSVEELREGLSDDE
jgi:hypothetical protein